MKINVPRVHGDTPKEKLIRSIALVLVFAAVAWAFMENNERVVERLNREGSVYDETHTLNNEQKKFIVSFTRALKSEFGLSCKIHIYGGDFVAPELDAKTMYIGLAPSIGEVELRFPGMMRQALGDDFIRALKFEYLLPSFQIGDWPQEIQIVLAAIFEKLTEIQQGDPSQ